MNYGGVCITTLNGEKVFCPSNAKTQRITDTIYDEFDRQPGFPRHGGHPIPPIQPTRPGKSKARHSSSSGSGDNRSGSGLTLPPARADQVVNYAMRTFKPATVTTNEIPIAARMNAELADFAYANAQLLDAGAEMQDIKNAWNGTIDESMVDWADMLERPSADTRTLFGELDGSLTDEYSLVFHNNETGITRAVFRGATEEKPVVLRGQFDESLNNFFEQNHFKTLRKAAVKYGGVNEVHGYSMGGGAAHKAVSLGLADEAITINPFVKNSVLQSGKHTIITQPYDVKHVLNHVLPNAGHNNPNVTEIVTPSMTTSVATGPSSAMERMLDAHGYENFLPNTTVAEEVVDSVLARRTAQEMASFLRPNTLADDAAAILRQQQQPTRLGAIGRGVGNFARGAALNAVGAIAAGAALDAAGVSNEYVHDVAGGVAGGVLEGAVSGAAAAYTAAEGGILAATLAEGAAAGPIGLIGGAGAAAGAYLSNRVGVDGAGKVAIETGTALVDTALGAVALSNWWNPFGWVAGGILAAEGLAVGIDAAIQGIRDDEIEDDDESTDDEEDGKD